MATVRGWATLLPVMLEFRGILRDGGEPITPGSVHLSALIEGNPQQLFISTGEIPGHDLV